MFDFKTKTQDFTSIPLIHDFGGKLKVWNLEFYNLEIPSKDQVLNRFNFKFNFESFGDFDEIENKNEKFNERIIRIYNSLPYYN